MAPEVIAALIGIVGITIGAIPTHLFMRQKEAAELEKLKSETDKTKAAVWDYKLGGYPVLKKLLSYREKKVLGRDLTPEEARAFTAIARRIAAILSLHPELDANYEAVIQNVYPWRTGSGIW